MMQFPQFPQFQHMPPRLFFYIGIVLACAALLPPVLAVQARHTTSEKPPIHPFLDMDIQPKFKAQSPLDLFADGRSSRPQAAGTVARGETMEDAHLNFGIVDGAWATTTPRELPLSMDLLRRGQDRFNIYCTACHGYAGEGNGTVNRRAMELVANASGPVNGTVWVPAKNIHDPTVTMQPIGQLFNTVTHGVRNMAGYGTQIPTADRWAIVAYVKALQRSFDAQVQDVPPDQRSKLP